MTDPNGPPAQTPPPGVPSPTSPQDAKNIAMIAHILNFTLIGPLIIYLMKKGSDAFLDDQSKEALNFALAGFIAHVVLIIFFVIPVLGWCLIGVLNPLIFIAQIVLGIMGGMKARDGIAYRYPFNYPFLK